MSLAKHSKRRRIWLSSFIICVFACSFAVWGIRELLFPATDVCSIERSEGKKLLDISQVYPIASNIELIGHIGGEAESVFVRGDIAFVKFGLELTALDIRNPPNPKRIGYILISGDLIHVDTNGNFAYIHSSEDRLGLWKIDISNPAQMSAVHIYKPIDYNHITSIRILDELAYITTKKCEYMYFLEGGITTRCDDTIHIIDTSNPSVPNKCYQGLWGKVIKSFAISGAPELITAPKTARQGNYSYVAEGKDGLKVYDVSNLDDRLEVGFYSPANKISNLFSFNKHIYASISEDQGVNMGVKHILHMFDIVNPVDPIDLGELSVKPTMIASSKNYAFLRDYPPIGLEILDMSLSIDEGIFTAPEQLSDIINMTIAGNRAYASTEDSKFLILDMSEMKRPTIITSQYIGIPKQRIDHISVSGKYAYIIVRDMGMKILDVSDETNIVEVGYYGGFYPGFELAVNDDYVYIAEQFGGFQIVDVSNPQQPIKVGEYDLDHQISKMQIVNNYMFMSAYRSGLQILDIDNPRDPLLVGSFTTGASVWSMDVDCPYIYVSGEYGLFVLRSGLVRTEQCD